MKGSSHPPVDRRSGFSLIELLVVVAILGILLVLGFSRGDRNALHARRSGADQLAAAVEQARTAAIVRRRPVLLALAVPEGGGTGGENRCRYGLFEVDELPADESQPVQGRPLSRWQRLPAGVILVPGDIEGLRNLIDGPTCALTWQTGASGEAGGARVHALAFTARGGLAWPRGSDVISVRLGSGSYRNGEAVIAPGGGWNVLRIGRVVARPWKREG